MIGGSCCCGAIRFTLTAPPSMLAICHCSRCRKAGASAFVFVDKADFHWVAGQELVQRFVPAPPYKLIRSFCRVCGSGLGEIGSDDQSFPVAANLLDDDFGLRPRFHEFVDEKPAWYEICDDAKQFPRHPVRSSA